MAEDPDSGQDLPVLDDGALQVLTDEAGEDAAQKFMEEYLVMLPVRAAKIFKGLTRGDTETTLEAIISLRVSSGMAGAQRLEAYCGSLESALKHGHHPDMTAVKAVLFANIRQVVREASRRGHLPPKSHGSSDS
ncbi:Hpt domain-containing protein [Arthrobacter sp. NPDC058097]|jgi:histidine phosphotransfer protein HptB|uniref:Hpt domain-containing protein n=1 Tax=Arthrobacter sp. NPDC058097 TaxID=3346340 RepID=UPI0036DB06D3